LVETLQRIGKIARPAVDPTVSAPTSEAAWHYRNKALVPFARDGQGQLVAGFYAPGSHTVVPLEDCPVQAATFVKVVHVTRDWLARADAPIYEPSLDRGWLRHLLVRTTSSGETLAALVTTSTAPPLAPAWAESLRRDCPFVTSVYQNVNDRSGNVVLGPRWRHVDGKKQMDETILGLRFRLSPGVFFQVNHGMAEALFRLATEMAAVGPSDVVWDLYAGVGVMGQRLARKAKIVWAVEENTAAVRDGIESLELNGIDNLRFRQGRCELVLGRGLIKDPPTVVLLDPPRAGCDRAVLRAVLRAKPQRIVYVSCDPGTLARDAHTLSTGGYHLRRAVPVDLFPQTAHIESVSLFEPAQR
jgi:23S rRNA (uracil1939-C5)-methyltransferase